MTSQSLGSLRHRSTSRLAFTLWKLLRGAFVAGLVGIVAYWWLILPWHSRWGATDAEIQMALPGDEMVPNPVQASTRAITIQAPPEKVWPWLVQIGQGRGGLYSYDWLENLVGCDIHTIDRILPELQQLKVGDQVRMGKPEGYPLFVVTDIQPNKVLILSGADPKTGQVTRPDALPSEYTNGVWIMYLNPIDEHTTRLIIRNRLAYNLNVGNTLVWRITEGLQFVMEQKMIRTLKERAESTSL